MSYLKSVFTLTLFTFLSLSLFGQLADVTEGCAALQVKFTAPSGSTFYWSFGDGSTSSQRNPTHNYLNPGTYNVEFGYSQGGPVVETVEINVYPKPVVSFVGDPQSGCVPLTTNFTDNSTVHPNITVTEYKWTFGGGPSGTGNPVNHTYTTIGNFDVSLFLETDLPNCSVTGGVDEFIKTSTLAASFTADDLSACAAPLTVNFTNTTDDPDNNLIYAWDLGNGMTSTDKNPPAQTYTQDGAYPITLTVTDSEGCSSTATNIVNIGSPLVGFNIADTLCSGIGIRMDNTSSNGDYLWNFGVQAEPMTSTERNPVVTFNNKQDYNIRLTVTDPDGCSSDTTITVHVDMIFADFTSDPAFSCQLPTTFNYTAPDPDIDSLIWTFDDLTQSNDMTGVYTVPGDTSIYGINGQQIINTTLTVFNERGCKGYFEAVDTVYAVNALYTVDTTMGCAPLTVTFYDSLSTASEAIVSYTYLWGDGSQDTYTNNDAVTHIYTTAGDYLPLLIIENATGCMDTSYAVPIFVGEGVTADFDANRTILCPGDSIFFMGTGDSRIDAWHFDTDGSRSSHCADDANPTWIFESMTGTMDVDLTVLYNGCATTISKADFLTVNGPKAEIDYSINCDNPFDVLFQDISMEATDRKWYLGNGDSSIILNPTITYPEGDYQVILEATSSMSSCPASYDTVTVSIRDLKAEFELEEFYCQGDEFDLDASMSTGVNADCWKGYTWFPFDTRPITTQDSIITYAWSGIDTQQVQLIVEDINGCRDTLRDTTFVVQTIANFTAVPDRICTPNEVNFTDLSTSNAEIVMWTWEFGDGDIDSMNQNTSHVYGAGSPFSLPDGTFNVTLTAEDEYGCTGMVTSPINIYTPEITLDIPDAQLCVGETLEFSATDITNEGSFLTYEWSLAGNSLGITGNSGTQVMNTAGEFELRVEFTEDATGCKSFETRFINVQAYPEATFTSDKNDNEDEDNCAGQITFTAGNQNNPDVAANGYTWDSGDGVLIFNQPATYSGNYDSGTDTVTLIVTTTFGCIDTFSRVYNFVAPEGNLTVSKTEVCAGDTLSFTVSDLIDVDSYRVDLGDGTEIENTDRIIHQYAPGKDQVTIALIMENEVGGEVCQAIETVVVDIKNFGLDLGPDRTICITDALDLTVTSTVTIDNSWNVVWSNGIRNSTTITVTPLEDTEYYIDVRDPFGCTDTDTLNVTVIDSIRIPPNSRTILVTDNNTSEKLPELDSALDSFNIRWEPNGGLDLTNRLQPVLTGGLPDGTNQLEFLAIVETENGCDRDTFIRIVQLVAIPNIFSPNGDMQNSHFNIIGDYSTEDIASFKVFNRWGQVVYNNENPTEGWDGRFNGEDQPVEVYVYIIGINLTDGTVKEISGDVTLIR